MAKFELEDINVEQKAKIKVVGAGGAGGNHSGDGRIYRRAG